MTVTKQTDTTERVEQKNFTVIATTSDTFSSVIAAGARLSGAGAYGSVVGDPGVQRLELLDLCWRIRVDTDDEAHTWALGSGLNASQRNLYPMLFWNDEDHSGDDYGNDRPPGTRIFGLTLVNNSADSHTYYIRWKIYSMRVTKDVSL